LPKGPDSDESYYYDRVERVLGAPDQAEDFMLLRGLHAASGPADRTLLPPSPFYYDGRCYASPDDAMRAAREAHGTSPLQVASVRSGGGDEFIASYTS